MKLFALLILFPVITSAKTFEINLKVGAAGNHPKKGSTFNSTATTPIVFAGSAQFLYAHHRLILGMGVDMHNFVVKETLATSPGAGNVFVNPQAETKTYVAKPLLPVYVVIGVRAVNTKLNKLFFGLHIGAVRAFGNNSRKYDEIEVYNSWPNTGTSTMRHVYEQQWGSGTGLVLGGEISYYHYLSRHFGFGFAFQPRYYEVKVKSNVIASSNYIYVYGGGTLQTFTTLLTAGIKVIL